MANVYHKYYGNGLKGHQQSQLASRKSSQVRVPSARHHFQDLPVTPRPARCRSGPPCAHPNTSVASRHPSPPRTLARNRAHLLGHAEAHSLTLPLPRRGPSSRSALGRGSRGSATEADRVGVAQTRLRGSARPPGASRRLPCSPRSMSEPPRSRRSARRAPPRCSALLRAPPAAARAVPTPGVGAALPGAGPGRHRPPDRDLCAPPRRLGRRRWAGARKVGKDQGRRWQGRGLRVCASSCERVGFALQPQVCNQESFLPGFWFSDCPFLRPLCTCFSGKCCLQGGTCR